MDDDYTTFLSLIALIILFYIGGLAIACYIRIRRIYLVRQIKNTGRVISLSSALITMLMQQMQRQRQQQLSPATGLPPPPPYSVQDQPTIQSALPSAPDELPPPYVESTSQEK